MENINLELYKVFYYVAKNKNITKTSQELLISQPAITQTVKKLEDQIGFKLFYRTKQGMSLTKEGEILFDRIKISIEVLENAKKELDDKNSEKMNIIRIGGGTTLLKHNLTKYLKEFIEKNPHTKIEIVHQTTHNLLKLLNENLLDIALCKKPNIQYENISFYPIEKAEYTFIAEVNIFKKYREKTIKKEELENLPFILQTTSASTRQVLDNICQKNKITLNNCYEMASYSLVLDFVKAGLGIGYINKNHVLKELENGDLYELEVGFEQQYVDICAAVNKKNIENKTINDLIKLIEKK